jgi:spermidine/putrescine-binding protein
VNIGLNKSKAITKMQAILLAVVVIIAVVAAVYFYTTTLTTPFITFCTWGGTEADNFKTIIANFKAAYNIDVKILPQASSIDTVATLRASQNHPTIDLWFAGGQAAITADEDGLLLNLSVSNLPNLANILPQFVHSTFIGYKTYEAGWMIRTDIPADLAYNGSLSWFFSPGLKGKIAVDPPSWESFVPYAAALAGGSPLNWTLGIQESEKLAPQLLKAYDSSVDLNTLFSTKAIWVAHGLWSDAKTFNDSGIPVLPLKAAHTDPTSPVLLETDCAAVIKGGKEDMALKFLNYIIDPNIQATYTYSIGTGPTNALSPGPPASLAPFILSTQEMSTYSTWDINYAYVAASMDNWTTAWNRDVTPLIGG